MSNDITEAEAVANIATRAVKPHSLDDEDRFYSLVVPEGGEHVVVDMLAERAERPPRKTGTFTVHDADSFVAYLGKHGLVESEVWADTIGHRLVGVVNAHEAVPDDATALNADDRAGYGDHRVVYSARLTKAWETWAAYDGKLLGQAEFAELIEDRAVDIFKPTGAEMLELAQSFQATTGVTFESSKALSSGERQLEYKETVDARAGKRGQLTIPKEFVLALVPFEGADAFKVPARFRYRITEGVLRLGYRLQRPEDVIREAFVSVVDKVAEQVTAPVFRGVSG